MIAFRSRLELVGFAFAAVMLVVLLALLVAPGSADARKQAQVRSEPQQAADALTLVWQAADASDAGESATSFCALVPGLSLPASQACG